MTYDQYDAMNQTIEQDIARLSINGKITIVREGIDCDGVRYTHRSVIDATLKAYNNHLDELIKWSDGPYSTRIESPDQCR